MKESKWAYLPHEKPIQDLQSKIAYIKKHSPGALSEIEKCENELHNVQREVYSSLTPWDRVLISRHPKRPHSIDYIRAITTDFIELHGDRTQGDDQAVVGGLARINSHPFMVIGQEKGNTTEDRVMRNFGMLSPHGFRKARRLMELAALLNIPVLSLLDTPGAYPGLEAEEKGQGRVIAENLMAMFSIRTPIIVVVVGEGCSGGALGMGVGDVVSMLEHSYYSVISPEGCASILWKDSTMKQDAAIALKMQAEDLLPFGIIDEIIQEPQGGAHYDPEAVYKAVARFAIERAEALSKIDKEILLESRYKKFREMGEVTIAETLHG